VEQVRRKILLRKKMVVSIELTSKIEKEVEQVKRKILLKDKN
jgi:hypothetical protein